MPPCASDTKLNTVWEKCADMPVHRYRIGKLQLMKEGTYQYLGIHIQQTANHKVPGFQLKENNRIRRPLRKLQTSSCY